MGLVLTKLPAGLAGGIGLARGKAGRAEGAPDGWSDFSIGDAGTTWDDAGRAGGDPDGWTGFSDVGAGIVCCQLIHVRVRLAGDLVIIEHVIRACVGARNTLYNYRVCLVASELQCGC